MSSDDEKKSSWFSSVNDHPKFEPFLEVAFQVLIGFVPFAIGAFAAIFFNPTFEGKDFFFNVSSYFFGGELSILIVTACGSILWMYFFKIRTSTRSSKFTTSVGVVILILFAGMVLSRNPGFEQNLPGWVHLTIVLFYIITLFLWFSTAFKQRQDIPATNSESAADALLKEAKKRGDQI